MGWHNLSEMGFYDFAQFLTLGLYLVSILLFVTGMLLKKPLLTSKAVTVLFLAFISHLGTTAYGIYIVGGNIIIRSEFFFNLLALTLMCTAFIISWRMKINLPLLAISPLVLLLYIASLTVQSVNLRELGELPALFLGLHVGSLFVSVSLFTLAFGAAIFYLLLERKIKTKEKINSFMQSIPPLLVVDTINNLAITIGFPLYTLGAVSGFFLGLFQMGQLFFLGPKGNNYYFGLDFYRNSFCRAAALWSSRTQSRLVGNRNFWPECHIIAGYKFFSPHSP